MTDWDDHDHCWHQATLRGPNFRTERCCICGAVNYVLDAEDRSACSERCRFQSDRSNGKDAFERKVRC